MRLERTIVRPDNSKVKIMVELSMRGYELPEWQIQVYLCAPKKRTWVSPYSGDDYQFRALSMEDRRGYVKSQQLKHVSEAEILEAKLSLWNQIKPV